jgi:hypothetical protein
MIAKPIVKGTTEKMSVKCKSLDKVWVKGTKQPKFFRCWSESKFLMVTSNTWKKPWKIIPEQRYEEMLAAWLATKLFIEENLMDTSINVDFENGKELSPWLLNKRINQF